MSFVSLSFVIFFVVIFSAIILLQKLRPSDNATKHWILLLSSYFFYGYWDWRFCLLLLFVTIVAYVAAIKSNNKCFFVSGIVVPLVVLGIFKYFNFFTQSFYQVFQINNSGVLDIILPVGISFYTFQALSYVIDVKRGQVQVERSFQKLALYIAFFPQLVAGPIVKARDFLPQLYEFRRITVQNCSIGIQIFLFGFFKKAVLADWLAVFVDDVFATPDAYHWSTLVFAAVAYSLQIYFDFSGYSDMAIGCARCFGYEFKQNFNVPYLSQSITEFWRRWHISLSTWLKEYLYIPLGGNRKGIVRQYINLMVTMVLGGLWHGANWTFVLWGTLHGLALCVHKFILHGRKTTACPAAIGIIITYVFVVFCWILFRSPDFATAATYINGIFFLQDGIVNISSWEMVSILLVAIASFCAIKNKKEGRFDGYYPIFDLATFKGQLVLVTEIGLILALQYTGQQPFIYFQF